MDVGNQQKIASRKPISRKSMMRYLTRFKLKKKQHQIQPRTFLNSQGLTTRRLQPPAPVEAKKPIISNNVKARLESNLQYLLQNQNVIATRVKQPESYISLQVNKLKAAAKKNHGKKETSKVNANDRVTSSESGPGTKSNRNDVNEIRSHKSPQEPRRVRPSKSVSFEFDNSDSFDFDVETVENQIRAGYGSTAPSLSGVPSDFFKSSMNKSPAEQFGWSFDEPKYTEPSSVSSKRFQFQPRAFKNHSKRSVSPTYSLDGFDPNPIEKNTVRSTRVIKSSLSRVGESPFMERIVIQKVKHSY